MATPEVSVPESRFARVPLFQHDSHRRDTSPNLLECEPGAIDPRRRGTRRSAVPALGELLEVLEDLMVGGGDVVAAAALPVVATPVRLQNLAILRDHAQLLERVLDL